MKFGFIAKHRGIWPVLWMCEALGVSRGGFYAWLTRPRSQRSRDDDELGAKVRASFLGSDRTYGARRVWRDLLTEGISCGLHRIERLMRLQALKARPRRRRLPPDLGERQAGAVAPNVLGRSFEAAAPNRKWIADFTYVWTAEGWLFVAAVIDLFSRRVVGWSMSAGMTAQLVTDALVMAIWRRGKPDALLHHSDRGSQSEFKWSSQRLERAAMKRWKRQSDRSGRAALRSPGRPTIANREQMRRFWAAISAGLVSEEAAATAGVPQAVGARWFRKAGGMRPAMFGPSAQPRSGRYLSLPEREEIALLRAQGCTIREMGRRIQRAASTVSRELRRNAATRSGGMTYRATTAQWHAERSACRPKQAKLMWNKALHSYVQDRLSGIIMTPNGVPVAGPAVSWNGRRHGRRQHRRWARAWSPEQIARRLPIEFPDDTTMRISHEAIYQALFIQGRGALRRELTACLRTGRALRMPRARTQRRGKNFVSSEIMISQRPAERESYAGDWVTRSIGGVVSRHFDDLDAVLEFDALDDFGQLIFALQSSPCFCSGVDQFEDHELGGLRRQGSLRPHRSMCTVANTLSIGLMSSDDPSARRGSRRRRAALPDPSSGRRRLLVLDAVFVGEHVDRSLGRARVGAP